MTLSETTKQLHTTLQTTLKRLGKDLFMPARVCRDESEPYLTIEAPQIRQILKAFESDLGENPQLRKAQKDIKQISQVDIDPPYFNEQNKYISLGRAVQYRNSLPESQSEALCNKWLDGLNPMIDRDPVAVLTELNTILENL